MPLDGRGEPGLGCVAGPEWLETECDMKLRYAGAILAVCGLLAAILASLSLSQTAQAATPTCVRYPNHVAYLCIGSNSAGGATYWTDYLYTREVYWHPAKGYLTATESYYCRNDRTPANGHIACSQNAPGVVAGSPEYARRVISLADGCIIQGWNYLDTVANPPAPKFCVGRATTSPEKSSAQRFWHAMAIIPGPW